jgi:hypothetical protein
MLTQLLASIGDRFHLSVLFLLMSLRVEVPSGYTWFMFGLFALLTAWAVLMFAIEATKMTATMEKP